MTPHADVRLYATLLHEATWCSLGYPGGLMGKLKRVLRWIGAAVLLGLGIDYSPIDPIKALFWSAVINGVIAVPMMAAMMYVAGSKKKMGKFRVGPVLFVLGWLSTAVMAAAAITMVWVSF